MDDFDLVRIESDERFARTMMIAAQFLNGGVIVFALVALFNNEFSRKFLRYNEFEIAAALLLIAVANWFFLLQAIRAGALSTMLGSAITRSRFAEKERELINDQVEKLEIESKMTGFVQGHVLQRFPGVSTWPPDRKRDAFRMSVPEIARDLETIHGAAATNAAIVTAIKCAAITLGSMCEASWIEADARQLLKTLRDPAITLDSPNSV